MSRHSTRRDFLKTSSILSAAYWVSGKRAEAQSNSPNEKINVASIGVAGKGSSDCSNTGKLANIVAICDIDEDRALGPKKKEFPDAKVYTDFRKLFDEMGGKIDAVTVSTPDHTHALAAIMAMKLGKHVYCQKPLTYSIQEARAMREVAAQAKVQTQMGNQGMTADNLRRSVELIQGGAIGKVREAHVWTNRPVWPQAPTIMARPKETPSIPPGIHWDLFLGGAPERPYNPCYLPKNWRGWWDFGTGALGDMGCHTTNMPFMALKLEYPTSVVAQAGDLNPETHPSWASVIWEFPARGDLPPVKLHWYEGKKVLADGSTQMNLPSADLFKGEPIPSSGSLLVGDKGTLFAPGDADGATFRFKLLPEKDFMGYEGPAPTLARNGGGDLGQKKEWIEAIKGGPAPFSNFGYAGLLTETILLGNLAIRMNNKKIEWDGPGLKSTNVPEAAQYVTRTYRKGWELT